MDKKITRAQIDKVRNFQKLILSAYEISETPKGLIVNLFDLAYGILYNIFLPEDDDRACKFFVDSFEADTKEDFVNFFDFFAAVIINFVNPPIDKNPTARDRTRRKFFRMIKVEVYLVRFFMMIKNDFLFFINIFKKAFGKSSQSPDDQIAIFMILHIYNEIAYYRVEYSRNPNIDYIHKFLQQPNRNSVGSCLQEAIFPVALNSSSMSSLSLTINLPESGDCLTVFTGNYPSSITELKSNQDAAENELINFLQFGVTRKTTLTTIIGADNPSFTFCSTFNSYKFLLRSPQGNVRRTNGNQSFATLNVLDNSEVTAAGLKANKLKRPSDRSKLPFSTLSHLGNFGATAADLKANKLNRPSDRCKLLFTSLPAFRQDLHYNRDESSFLVGITENDLQKLDEIVNECMSSLIRMGLLDGHHKDISLLMDNFSIEVSREEEGNLDLNRFKSLTGEVDLSTGEIKENDGIFRQGDSWYLSPEVSENSKVFIINEGHNSGNWIRKSIIGQNLQNNSGAEAATSKNGNSLSLKNWPVLGSENWSQEIKKVKAKPAPISENFPPLPSKSNQNAGAKKPAKKDSVNKQSKKADAKKLTAKKDAKKTTKSKTAAKKKTTK